MKILYLIFSFGLVGSPYLLLLPGLAQGASSVEKAKNKKSSLMYLFYLIQNSPPEKSFDLKQRVERLKPFYVPSGGCYDHDRAYLFPAVFSESAADKMIAMRIGDHVFLGSQKDESKIRLPLRPRDVCQTEKERFIQIDFFPKNLAAKTIASMQPGDEGFIQASFVVVVHVRNKYFLKYFPDSALVSPTPVWGAGNNMFIRKTEKDFELGLYGKPRFYVERSDCNLAAWSKPQIFFLLEEMHSYRFPSVEENTPEKTQEVIDRFESIIMKMNAVALDRPEFLEKEEEFELELESSDFYEKESEREDKQSKEKYEEYQCQKDPDIRNELYFFALLHAELSKQYSEKSILLRRQEAARLTKAKEYLQSMQKPCTVPILPIPGIDWTQNMIPIKIVTPPPISQSHEEEKQQTTVELKSVTELDWYLIQGLVSIESWLQLREGILEVGASGNSFCQVTAMAQTYVKKFDHDLSTLPQMIDIIAEVYRLKPKMALKPRRVEVGAYPLLTPWFRLLALAHFCHKIVYDPSSPYDRDDINDFTTVRQFIAALAGRLGADLSRQELQKMKKWAQKDLIRYQNQFLEFAVEKMPDNELLQGLLTLVQQNIRGKAGWRYDSYSFFASVAISIALLQQMAKDQPQYVWLSVHSPFAENLEKYVRLSEFGAEWISLEQLKTENPQFMQKITVESELSAEEFNQRLHSPGDLFKLLLEEGAQHPQFSGIEGARIEEFSDSKTQMIFTDFREKDSLEIAVRHWAVVLPPSYE